MNDRLEEYLIQLAEGVSASMARIEESLKKIENVLCSPGLYSSGEVVFSPAMSEMMRMDELRRVGLAVDGRPEDLPPEQQKQDEQHQAVTPGAVGAGDPALIPGEGKQQPQQHDDPKD